MMKFREYMLVFLLDSLEHTLESKIKIQKESVTKSMIVEADLGILELQLVLKKLSLL